MKAGRKGGVMNAVIGLAVLGLTVFVVGFAFKKGGEAAAN
tara:strand:+ start:3148 stop:3267 length:120 start_codon:yes stop_codon:yes gene_type:complete